MINQNRRLIDSTVLNFKRNSRYMYYVHQISRRIAFHQCDPAGVLHFSECLILMEQCEHSFMRSIGVPVIGVVKWPRVSVSCDYKKPLRYDEVALVNLVEGKCGDSSIRYKFNILNEVSGETVAIGCLTIACRLVKESQYTSVPHPIPTSLKTALTH